MAGVRIAFSLLAFMDDYTFQVVNQCTLRLGGIGAHVKTERKESALTTPFFHEAIKSLVGAYGKGSSLVQLDSKVSVKEQAMQSSTSHE
ncbi:MAG: hypothetical protein Q9227_005326 [Pyrenula ochraceoflavens]